MSQKDREPIRLDTRAETPEIDTGAERQRSPYITPSQIETAARCGALYSFRHVEKIRKPPNASLAIGRWMDEVLNVAWRHRKEFGVPHPIGALLAGARRAWDDEIGRVPKWDLETSQEVVRDWCFDALVQYMNTWATRLVPVAVQPWLELPAGVVADLRVLGRADLVATDTTDGRLWVIDHKTKGRRYYSPKCSGPSDETITELRRNMQLSLYAAALAQKGTVPVGIRWIGLIWSNVPCVQTVEILVTSKTIAWVLAAARGAARTIAGGDYFPNPTTQWCPRCEYGQECSEKYGANGTPTPEGGQS